MASFPRKDQETVGSNDMEESEAREIERLQKEILASTSSPPMNPATSQATEEYPRKARLELIPASPEASESDKSDGLPPYLPPDTKDRPISAGVQLEEAIPAFSTKVDGEGETQLLNAEVSLATTPATDAATTTPTGGEAPSVTSTISRIISSPGAFSIRGMNGNSSDDGHTDEIDEENPPEAPDLEAGRTIGSNNTTDAVAEEPRQDHIVEAVAVQDDHLERAQIEAEIRNTIMQEAVQADVLPVGDPPQVLEDGYQAIPWKKGPDAATSKRSYACAVASVSLLLALGLGLGLGLSKRNGDGSGSTTELDSIKRPTLEVVKERGYVRCGMNNLAFASLIDPDSSDQLEGFNVQQCRAMASLVFGDPDKFEQVWVTPFSRFQLLADGDIDITTEGTTYTMGRDVYEANTKSAFTFSTPYFYSGLAFGGIPTFVDCADNLEDFRGECRGLRICAASGTTHLSVLSSILGGGTVVPYNGTAKLIEGIQAGTCNVVASEPIFLTKFSKVYVTDDWNIDWKLGTKLFSKEPLSLVTRQDDPEWSALADIAVNAFYLAEAHNVSKDNANEMANLSLVSQDSDSEYDLVSSIASMISELGNHGDLYDLHIEDKVPRQGLNEVYDKDQSTGLLYSIPLGKYTQLGSSPNVNGTLAAVLERDYLLCGVIPSRGTGFASSSQNIATETLWSGMDVQFCRGLAASLFAGDSGKVVFVELQGMEEASRALAHGTVNVVAGARVTMQATLQEPSTGLGYKFSSPYYYDNDTRDAFAFMTANDDPQWSDFVYWIVMGIIFAEEEGITAETSVEMPIVSLFGEHLKQMFRDCVSSVGNYAELYNSTLQDIVPRAGANRLNEGLAGPQLFPISII